jgi:DNA polymerase III gamma/tau subunit
MTTMTLDKKYRPMSLEYVHGNNATVKAIEKVLHREDDIPGTMLFQGPSGCGKTTLARIVASMLSAEGRDLKEYNISNMRGIDKARDIIRLVGVTPWGARRVIILNECHKATNEFQNAMLEVLEEPPPRNHFILCTTEPQKLLRTIKTRASTFTVRPLKEGELQALVAGVAQAEEANMSERVLGRIARLAEGSPRSALVILDGIIDLETDEEMEEALATYTARQDSVLDLCRALLDRNPWKNVVPLIKGIDDDPETIRRGVMSYFEKVLLGGGQQAPRAAMMMDYFARPFWDIGRPGLTQACYLAINTN